MLYDALCVSEVAGMDRVPVLAVDDEVAVRVHYQALDIRVEVLLTSSPRMLFAGGYCIHVILQKHALLIHLLLGELWVAAAA